MDAFFIIQTSDRALFFTILEDKLHSFNIQDLSKYTLSLRNKL